MKTNRRDFLKLTAISAAGAGLACGAMGEANASHEPVEFGPDVVAKLYDSTKCIGCQSCVVACYNTNFKERDKYIAEYLSDDELNFIEKEDLLPKVRPEDEFNPEKPWLNVVSNDYRLRTTITKYVDDDGKAHFMKNNCMHCKKPGCVSACPVSAMQKDEKSGIVTWDANRCVGCRYCQMACPFNVPKFEWHRAVAKIVKCDMCWSTLGKGGAPKEVACAKVCPANAVIYGKRSDLLAEAKKRIADNPGKYYNDMVFGDTIYGGTDELFLADVDYKKLGFPTDKIPEYSYAEKSEGLQHTIYKMGIAPIALYTALAVVAYRNNKKHHNSEGEDK